MIVISAHQYPKNKERSILTNKKRATDGRIHCPVTPGLGVSRINTGPGRKMAEIDTEN